MRKKKKQNKKLKKYNIQMTGFPKRTNKIE